MAPPGNYSKLFMFQLWLSKPFKIYHNFNDLDVNVEQKRLCIKLVFISIVVGVHKVIQYSLKFDERAS